MANVDIDFNDVADTFMPLEAGVYDLKITEEPTIEDTKDGTSQKLVIQFEVIDHPNEEYNGRKIRDQIGFKAKTRLKRLGLSAGLPMGQEGFDTADLNGAVVKGVVKQSQVMDSATGEPRIFSNVTDYLIPKDDDES